MESQMPCADTTTNQTLTIVTATFNAEKYITRLADSLRGQSDKKFRWIVADGLSNDNTLKILENVLDIDMEISSEEDFGIYDALNRAIKRINEGYYLVVGADDVLDRDAILNYKKCIVDFNFPEFITTCILRGGKIIRPMKNLGWLYGLSGMASSHAVGMIIRVDLHKRFGYYSSKLPIAADQLFFKSAINSGATIKYADFLAGEFSTDGTSGSDSVGLLTELLRVQLLTEKIAFIQILLFTARILKFYLKSLLGR